MKFGKYAIFCLGIIAILFIFLIQGAAFFLSSSAGRGFVVEKVNSSILGKVSISEISISPFKGEIDLDEVCLDGPGGSPIARIARIGRIHANIGFAALLRGQILVSELRIIRPEFLIYETATGQLNLMSIVKPSEQEQGQKIDSDAASGLPFNIVIGDARITGGMAVYTDNNIKTSLVGLNVKANYDLGLGSGYLKIEIPSAMLDVPGFRTGFAPAVLEATLKKGDVTTLNLDAVTGFGRLSLKGGIRNLFENPYFDLLLDTYAGLEGIKKACGLDMKMNGVAAGTVRATGTIGNPEAYARLACLSGKFGDLSVSGAEAESYMKNRLAVIRLKSKESGGGLDAGGYADLASAFPFSFFTDKSDIERFGYGVDARLENLRLKSLVKTGETLESGNISGTVSCDLRGVSLPNMTGSAEARITGRNLGWSGRDKAKKTVPGSLRLDTGISLAGGMLEVKKLSLDAAGTGLEGKGRFSFPSDSFAGSVRVDSPDLEKIADVSGLLKARGSLKAEGEFSGTLANPVFEAKASAVNLGIEGLSLGNLEMDAELNDKGDLKVSKLNLKNKDAEVSASGSVRVRGEGSMPFSDKPSDLRVSVRNLDPSFFLKDSLPFSGVFDADLMAKNQVSEDGVLRPYAEIKADARNLSSSGIRMGRASLKAGLSKGVVDVKDLTLTNRSSEISLAASLGLFRSKSFEINKDPAINAIINKASLNIEDFFPGIEGQLSGSGSVSGTLMEPSGRMDFNASRLVFDKIRLRSADLALALKGKRLELERLDVHPVEKESLKLEGWIERSGDYSVSMTTDGLSLSSLRDEVSLSKLSGTLSASIQGRGNINDPRLGGSVSFSRLGANGHIFRDFSLKLDLLGKMLRMESQPDPGLLGLWMDLGKKKFGADLDLKEIDLAPFFKAAGFEDFKGTTGAIISASGNFNEPDRMRAEAEIKSLGLRYRDFDLLGCNSFKASLKNGIISLLPSDIKVMKKGSLNLTGKWDLKTGLDFNLNSSINLDDAAPLIPDILPDIEGTLSVGAGIKGRPDSPVMEGKIGFKDIGFTIPETFQKLHDLSGSIKMTPSRVEFEKIRGMMDDGSFSLAGNMNLDGLKASAIDLRMRARNLPVRAPDAADLVCNIDLSLSGNGDSPFLSGETVILEGVYYKDVDLSLISMPSRPVRKKPPFWESIENPFLKNMDLDITIKKREPFQVDNNFANLELSPDLRLIGKLSAPVIEGRCKVDSGTIYYRKNEYDVKKGVIDFINPYKIEPEFDIESSSKIKKWTVTLKISGTPDKLDFDLSSDPPLDDNDILSLVILGNVSKDVSASQAAKRPASEMLGEMLASTFSDEIKSVSGLDILEAGDSSSEDEDLTSVTIGKTLSKRLAVKYSVDSKAGEVTQKAMAEYKLLENLILNGFRDSQGVYGGELQYRLEFR